jgi:hypothetical protein
MNNQEPKITSIQEYKSHFITEYEDGTCTVSLIPHPNIEAAKKSIDKVVDIKKF